MQVNGVGVDSTFNEPLHGRICLPISCHSCDDSPVLRLAVVLLTSHSGGESLDG